MGEGKLGGPGDRVAASRLHAVRRQVPAVKHGSSSSFCGG
jgi:hypothetical protein